MTGTRRRALKASASHPTSNQGELATRLLLSGCILHEPYGQDGRRCQLLAVSHQLRRHGLLGTLSVSDLEDFMVSWLLSHQDDILSLTPLSDGSESVSRLHDFVDHDEFQATVRRQAQGDHLTLAVTLAMLEGSMGVQADVQIYDWRGGNFDCIVRAPDVYGVIPKVCLQLGYTGSHYLSVVPWKDARPSARHLHVW